MSKNKLVTSNQTDSVRDMANAKGVTRAQFQAAQDDGRVSRFLDSLIKVDSKAITQPQGARIYTLRVKVKLDRPWQDAVSAVGPNTPNEYNVRKVGDLYVPTGTKEVWEELILLSYLQGDGTWDKALTWAQTQGLKNTVPREVFAIGEQYPTLHLELGLNPMFAVATTECSFGGLRSTCCVWWHASVREAFLNWVSFFVGSDVWFVFRK